MKEQPFWRLIAESRAQGNGDLADQLVALENRLVSLRGRRSRVVDR